MPKINVHDRDCNKYNHYSLATYWVGGEVGLCQGFLPLLVTFEGMTFASSSCSSSSSLPLFPPRCSTSSSSSPNTFSLFPLPLVRLTLPLFIPFLWPGFLWEEARGGVLNTALPKSLSLGSDSLTSSKAACRSASTWASTRALWFATAVPLRLRNCPENLSCLVLLLRFAVLRREVLLCQPGTEQSRI